MPDEGQDLHASSCNDTTEPALLFMAIEQKQRDKERFRTVVRGNAFSTCALIINTTWVERMTIILILIKATTKKKTLLQLEIVSFVFPMDMYLSIPLDVELLDDFQNCSLKISKHVSRA
jgi:hypothetical protein